MNLLMDGNLKLNMMKKLKRVEVYDIISGERKYQEHMCALKSIDQKPTVEGELLILKSYIDKTLDIWLKDRTNKRSLNEIRKIAGVAIRCLENHGCERRDISKGILNNEN